MTTGFRLLLIAAAFLSFAVVIRNINKSRLRISDSIFWFLLAALLILLAVFPQIAYFFGGLLGIISTVNLVFLVIIALLLFRLFALNIRVSELDGKLEELARTITLNEHDNKRL